MSQAEDAGASGITELIDALMRAYTAKDAKGAADLFTVDAIAVGTGADEVRFGRDEILVQLERDTSQADELRLRYEGLRTGERGNAAWCFADLTADVTVGAETITMPMRFSAAAVRTDDGWRFVESHLSLPFAGQIECESFAQPVDSDESRSH